MKAEKELLKNAPKKVLIIEIISFTTTLLLYLGYLLSFWINANRSVSDALGHITKMATVVTLLSVVGYVITLVVEGIKFVYRNVTGKNSVSKQYFEQLDYLGWHWGEPNTFLIKRIGSIKYFYDSPEICKLIENNRLDIFYDRHFQVMNRLEVSKNLTAIAEGVAASFIYGLFGVIVRNMP